MHFFFFKKGHMPTLVFQPLLLRSPSESHFFYIIQSKGNQHENTTALEPRKPCLLPCSFQNTALLH